MIRSPRTRRVEPRAVVRRLVWAARLASEIVPYVRRYGADVRTRERISRGRQLRQLAALWWRYGTSPDSYYRFQLYRPDRLPRASRFLDREEHRALLRPLTWSDTRAYKLMNDKRRLEAWMLEHGLPAPPTLAVANQGKLTPDVPLPEEDLFVKPANLSCGRGAELWRYDATLARYVDHAGALHSADTLRSHVLAASQATPMLVQRRLRNHPMVADLTAGGLCTVRLVTVRDIADEASVPLPLLARYRLPVGNAPADNFAAGGLAAPVELQTGRLGPAVAKDLHRRWDQYSTHPTTGAPIEGRILPDWDAAVALALRAHTFLPPYPVVGWDVVLSDAGPLLLEANSAPCAALSQMVDDLALAETAYAPVVMRALAAYYAR
jgi:hypothetical protein